MHGAFIDTTLLATGLPQAVVKITGKTPALSLVYPQEGPLIKSRAASSQVRHKQDATYKPCNSGFGKIHALQVTGKKVGKFYVCFYRDVGYADQDIERAHPEDYLRQFPGFTESYVLSVPVLMLVANNLTSTYSNLTIT